VIFCITFEEVSNPSWGGGGQKARKTNYQETDVASGLRRNKTEITKPILLRNGQITELNVARTLFIFVKLRTQQTPCCQTTPSTEGLIYCKVKVKCTLVQALRLCKGRTAHRGSRGIALPFHDHFTRRGWGVSVTPRPLFTPGKDPVPFVQEAGWAPGPVWTGAENLVPTGIRSLDRPARSQSLYTLSYPAPYLLYCQGIYILSKDDSLTQICVTINTLQCTARCYMFRHRIMCLVI
jgi:hypothetical protein